MSLDVRKPLTCLQWLWTVSKWQFCHKYQLCEVQTHNVHTRLMFFQSVFFVVFPVVPSWPVIAWHFSDIVCLLFFPLWVNSCINIVQTHTQTISSEISYFLSGIFPFKNIKKLDCDISHLRQVQFPFSCPVLASQHPILPINHNTRVVQQSLRAFLAGTLIYLCKSPKHPQWITNIFSHHK